MDQQGWAWQRREREPAGYCLHNLDTQVGHLLLMSTVTCWWPNAVEISKSLFYLPQAVTFVNKMPIITSLSLCSS